MTITIIIIIYLIIYHSSSSTSSSIIIIKYIFIIIIIYLIIYHSSSSTSSSIIIIIIKYIFIIIFSVGPKNKDDFKHKIRDLSLYTGENVLHIIIVHRNFHEVRWLLNFYRDHIHSFPEGLPSLLSSRAIGTFFQRKVFSRGVAFGSTPLQFAVSSNDREIFKLVYSFCSVASETILPNNSNQNKNQNNNDHSSSSSNGYINNNSVIKQHKSDHDTASMTSVSKNNPISDFGPATIFKTDENGK